MRKLFITALVTTALLAVSCGQKHKAQGLVEKFLDQNLVNADYSLSCSDVGSTVHIDDNRLRLLRDQTANSDSLFKKGIKYGDYRDLPQLLHIRATIVQGTDTFVRTVYLHPELYDDGVLAVKEN